MNDKVKTMAVPVYIKEANDTGLISEEAEQALKHEKLKAEEKINQLQELYKNELISASQLDSAVKKVQQELAYRILNL